MDTGEPPHIILLLISLLALFLMSMFFSSAETAFLSLNKLKLRFLRERNNRAAVSMLSRFCGSVPLIWVWKGVRSAWNKGPIALKNPLNSRQGRIFSRWAAIYSRQCLDVSHLMLNFARDSDSLETRCVSFAAVFRHQWVQVRVRSASLRRAV